MSHIITSRQCVKCPDCRAAYIDITDVSTDEKPVKCPNCCIVYNISITKDDQLKVEKYNIRDKEPSYTLLQIDPLLTKEPIYVIHKSEYMFRKGSTPEQEYEDNKFYVEEHTCPTNLVGGMNNVFGVYEYPIGNHRHNPQAYDCDYHGFFRLLSIVPATEIEENIEIDNLDNIQAHENANILKYLLDKVSEKTKLEIQERGSSDCDCNH